MTTNGSSYTIAKLTAIGLVYTVPTRSSGGVVECDLINLAESDSVGSDQLGLASYQTEPKLILRSWGQLSRAQLGHIRLRLG